MEHVIDEGHDDLVHHLVFSYCNKKVGPEWGGRFYSPYSSMGNSSFNDGIPRSVRYGCYASYIYAWSKGGMVNKSFKY